MRRPPLATLPLLVVLVVPGDARAGAQGPAPYRCFDATQTTPLQTPFSGSCSAESPFAALVRDEWFTYFHLMSDGAYETAPGMVATPATGTYSSAQAIDSDDGIIDNKGVCVHGTSDWDTTYTFDEEVLGALPTHVGLVVTYVFARPEPIVIEVEVFGPGGMALGAQTAAAGVYDDSSADRFFGWSDPRGISSFRVLNTEYALSVILDDLQYGARIAPIPALGGTARGSLVLLLTASYLLRFRSPSTHRVRPDR